MAFDLSNIAHLYKGALMIATVLVIAFMAYTNIRFNRQYKRY